MKYRCLILFAIAFGFLGSLETQAADSPPTAVLQWVTPPTMLGVDNVPFRVRYTDADSTVVKAVTIGDGDVLVTGPNGYSQLAKLTSKSDITDTTPIDGTYLVRPPNWSPGVTWIAADNGTYTLSMVANEVSDTGNNYVAVKTLGTFNINLTGPTPTLSINNISHSEGDSGQTAYTFTVSLSSTSTQAVSVNYATADSTATVADNDYVAKSGTLTIPAGQSSGTITVYVNGDTKSESIEEFYVNLSNPVGATIADGQGIGVISNDDQVILPTMSIGDVTLTEGNSGTKSFVFTVTLSAASASLITANYATADGTATTADNDYNPDTGFISIQANQTSTAVTIYVDGDTKVESDEYFYVNLSNPNGATIADGQGKGTITNDDAVSLSINNISHSEGNSGQTAYTFTISLSSTSTQAVSVNYATADSTATVADNDYVAKSGTLTIPAGQSSGTITVYVNGDTKSESIEEFYVNLSNPVGATIADGQGIGVISNDDQQTIDITASASYQASTKQLTLTATAYNRATASFITTGNSSYFINGLGNTGQLTFNGSVWTATVNLSSSPPAPGQYTVTVTIGTGSAICVFNVGGSAGQIIGTVKNVAGAPLSGIRVDLYYSVNYFSSGPSSIASCVSEANSFYHFDGIMPSQYIVDVNAAGYLPQHHTCAVSNEGEAQANFCLSPNRTLGQLVANMSCLRQDVEDAMRHETGLLSLTSYQAIDHLSCSLDAWDALSLFGDLINPEEAFVHSIANMVQREQFLKAIVTTTSKSLWPLAIDVAQEGLIQGTAQTLLPPNANNWHAWDSEELWDLQIWTDSFGALNSGHNDFIETAGALPVATDFDFSKAEQLIATQREQIWEVRQTNPIRSIILADPYAEPNKMVLDLSVPSSWQVWQMDHAMISMFGAATKCLTAVQVTSGVVAVGTAATGVGGAAAGTVYAVSSVAKDISGIAETTMRFHGGFTYGATVKGWIFDINMLPLCYQTAASALHHEAMSPYYLSSKHNFSAGASLNLNTLPGNILVPLPFLPGAFSIATVPVTNTSDVATKLTVVPSGWWDYHLPGDWPYIGEFFGGVTEIKMGTTVGAPQSVTLGPGASDVVLMPYLGFYIDPINMFNPHWLKVDVYAGPFLTKSLSQPYYVFKVLPFMMSPAKQRASQSMSVAASYEKGGQAKLMGDGDYAEMVPVITTLATGDVNANVPVIEEEFTVDVNMWAISFKLISDDRAHISLRVYDINGNCVGYDTSKGGVQNEFIAKYIGEGHGHQSVDIPSAAGKTYTVKAVLEGAATNESFDVQLFAFGTPIRPAVLAIMPASIFVTTQPNNTLELQLNIGEAGQQQPLHDVNVRLSNLVGPDGNTILTVVGPNYLDINNISAASSKGASFVVSVPNDVPAGDYTGEITVNSSNAGSVVIPVTIGSDDIADLTYDGIVNVMDLEDFAKQWLLIKLLADANEDGVTDIYDLGTLCSEWLQSGPDLQADFNGDETTDFGDFAILAAEWQRRCPEISADFNGDGRVDFLDYARLAEKWLWEASWHTD